MAEPSTPPSPGMPASVLEIIKTCTWSDQHLLLPSAPPLWLRVSGTPPLWLRVSGTPSSWSLGGPGPGAYSIARDTFDRLVGSTAQSDGSLIDAGGGAWWLGTLRGDAIAREPGAP